LLLGFYIYFVFFYFNFWCWGFIFTLYFLFKLFAAGVLLLLCSFYFFKSLILSQNGAFIIKIIFQNKCQKTIKKQVKMIYFSSISAFFLFLGFISHFLLFLKIPLKSLILTEWGFLKNTKMKKCQIFFVKTDFFVLLMIFNYSSF